MKVDKLQSVKCEAPAVKGAMIKPFLAGDRCLPYRSLVMKVC